MRSSVPCSATLLSFAEDETGFPRMDFEVWYQQGLRCFAWRLPKPLVRQAFQHLCQQCQVKGKLVAMWQIRTFVWACRGAGGAGRRRIAKAYRWPVPPDPSWEVVVCVYPDGLCDLDMLHPVSRRFWSEDNGFFDLPSNDRTVVNRCWFEELGFTVMLMSQSMLVIEREKNGSHLRAMQ